MLHLQQMLSRRRSDDGRRIVSRELTFICAVYTINADRPCRQQAFRERKVQRFRDFQGEVETLNNTISRLEGENSDLRTSLRDARTEIEILRSMLPQITRIMTPDQAAMSKSDQDQQLQALLLKLGLNGILRGIAASNGLEP